MLTLFLAPAEKQPDAGSEAECAERHADSVTRSCRRMSATRRSKSWSSSWKERLRRSVENETDPCFQLCKELETGVIGTI